MPEVYCSIHKMFLVTGGLDVNRNKFLTRIKREHPFSLHLLFPPSPMPAKQTLDGVRDTLWPLATDELSYFQTTEEENSTLTHHINQEGNVFH